MNFKSGILDRTNWALSNGRLALFTATMAPAAIVPVSGCSLHNPFEVASWTAISCTLAALVPHRRWAMVLARLYVLLLPLVIIWIGTVAATGMGPSSASLLSAITADHGELISSVKIVMHKPSFFFTSLTVAVAVGWALIATKRLPEKSDNSALIFFFAILVLVGAANVDTVPRLRSMAGVESKIMVPMFSFCSLAKNSLYLADERINSDRPAGSASSAPRMFTAARGLSVFVIGESLRADSLTRRDRGVWSNLLLKRISDGLGARVADACSYGNATIISVPKLITGYDISKHAGISNNSTILAFAKSGGACTAIINNHNQNIINETGHNFNYKVSTPDESVDDSFAVEALRYFTTMSAAGKKAAIVHLYGQHMQYADRYPPGTFGPEPNGLTPAEREELQYERAAEYGVKILLDMAKILDEQSEPSFLIFTSDHGENLPSDGTGKKYHGGPFTGKHETTVPVLILWNKAFADSGRLRGVQTLLKASGVIAHQDVSNAWLELAGWKGKSTVTISPNTLGTTSSSKPFGTLKYSELPP